MNCITEALSEKLYVIYDGVNTKKKPVKYSQYKSGSLCWSCQHAVPSSDGKRGCEWSLRNEEVPGWEAIPGKIPSSYRTANGQICRKYLKTYHVISCPRFMED